MRAAAHGDIELEGMSKEEAREYVEGHKTKHLPERVEKFVQEKRKLKKGIGINTGELGAQISDNLQGKSEAEKMKGRVTRGLMQDFATNMSRPTGNLATMKSLDKSIHKNVGANRISSGMEEYIISWIQNHPYLEDKEFDRFLESSGFRPEQGKEVLYRYINGLRKSLPAKINKFVRRKKLESLPYNQGTFGVSQAGVGARI